MELEAIHKLIISKDATIAQLDTAASALAAFKQLASGERQEICKKRHDLLLSGNEKELAKIDAELAGIDRRRERLDALETAHMESLARAKDLAKKVEVAELLDKTMKSKAAARNLLENDYLTHARKILDILERVATADLAVAAYNRHVPASEQLRTVEEDMNFDVRRNRQDVSREVVSLWCFPQSGEPLSDDLQTKVVDRGDGLGWLRPTSRAQLFDMEVVLSSFERIEYLPRRQHEWQPQFSESLRLPPLPGRNFQGWNGDVAGQAYRVLEVLSSQRDLECAPADDRRTFVELRPVTKGDATKSPSSAVRAPIKVQRPISAG